MERSRLHGRQFLALAAFGLLACLSPRRAAAQGVGSAREVSQQTPVDVLILLGSATGWAARVRGQLSDLPVRARSEALPASEQAAFRSSAFARRQAADVTVWLATDGDPAAPERGGAYVAVWLADAQDLYTRLIAADWRALSAADRSAALELAALSVRSSVRSLLLDAARTDPAAAVAGAVTAESDATPPGEGHTAAAVESDVTLPPRPSTGSSMSERPDVAALDFRSMLPSGLELEVGGAWQLYTRSAPGTGGLRAGVRVSWASWAFELIGQYGVPSEAQLGPARLELVRHALIGEAHYFAWEHEAWRLSPLLRAGMTSIRRRSKSSEGAALRPLEAARYDFPTFGLGAIAELSLTPRLSVSLRTALNLETAAPTFAVQTASGASAWSTMPWALQPSLEVGANWHF
jgi:hypothetical protein